jgi:hypothetical protein
MNANIFHVCCETHALSKSYRQFEELKLFLNTFIENSMKTYNQYVIFYFIIILIIKHYIINTKYFIDLLFCFSF